MNSFQRFGFDHLSASSLNLWRTSPGIWALRYIAKIKDGGSPAMWRGTAVENGLAFLLRGQTLDAAVGAAHQSFDLNAKDYSEDSTDERDLIAPMVEQCVKWTAPSALIATQVKIEHWFDPVPIPVIGYLDFAFDETDVDLKTTKACPSTPRSDHVRQVSIYRAARLRQGGILYVTGKRHQYFPVTDDMMNEALNELHADALSLNNFLARCDGKEDVLRSLPIDWTHFQAPKTKVPLADILMAG
jgi:hypothetical protein